MVVMRWFVGSPVARVYLTVVGVVFVYELWYLLTSDGPTMAGVLSYVLTAPTSWLLEYVMAGLGGGLWSWAALVLVGALANVAAVKGLRAWGRRLSRPPQLGDDRAADRRFAR